MVDHPASVTMSKLYGLASPPTSYGGYGGNAKEDAKYTFEYPSAWKKETVGKVQLLAKSSCVPLKTVL